MRFIESRLVLHDGEVFLLDFFILNFYAVFDLLFGSFQRNFCFIEVQLNFLFLNF